MIWLYDLDWWRHTTLGGYVGSWVLAIAIIGGFYAFVIGLDALLRGVRGLFRWRP